MLVRKTKECMLFDPRAPAKITKMGNITDLVVCDRITREPVCVKVSKDSYIDTRTGEILDYAHTINRSQCYDSIRKTMQKIRELVNTNVTNVFNIRWVTLTYKENMTDSERLYHDYEKFWKRFIYYCENKGYGKPEYITVVEPQGRGAWHIHGLLIWQNKAPYIDNSELREIWGNGFVSIKQPRNCDNLGAYFCAYLADMPVEDIEPLSEELQIKAKIAASILGSNDPVDVISEDGKAKKVVKGARLAMYPPGMNIYRHSRNVKKPEIVRTTYEKAREYLADSKETYYQGFEVLNDDGCRRNRILKASYNSKRK